MNAQEIKDIKDTALKLDAIREHCPEDYFYLKGWIHCLLQTEERTGRYDCDKDRKNDRRFNRSSVHSQKNKKLT